MIPIKSHFEILHENKELKGIFITLPYTKIPHSLSDGEWDSSFGGHPLFYLFGELPSQLQWNNPF